MQFRRDHNSAPAAASVPAGSQRISASFGSIQVQPTTPTAITTAATNNALVNRPVSG